MITIVDYGLGNLGSIMNMFRRVGVPAECTKDPDRVASANKLLLPGVGAFDQGMKNIQNLGLKDALNQRVVHDQVPVMGICLGMQLMVLGSEEGEEKGLGWVNATSRRFSFEPDPDFRRPKIPHMGWAYVHKSSDHHILDAFEEDTRFYFVHSFHMHCEECENELLKAYYGKQFFTAGLTKGNILGFQFHPEKSHRFGMELFKSFAKWEPIRHSGNK